VQGCDKGDDGQVLLYHVIDPTSELCNVGSWGLLSTAPTRVHGCWQMNGFT
jgi:hypothetical protein